MDTHRAGREDKGTTQNTQETSAFRKTPKLLVRGDHKILTVSARLGGWGWVGMGGRQWLGFIELKRDNSEGQRVHEDF